MTTTTQKARERGRALRFIAARLDRTSYLGLHLTIGLLALAVVIWAFGALLTEILENAWLVEWDKATSLRIHQAMTPGTTAVARFITDAGSPGAMAVLTVSGVLLLWRHHRLLAQTWIAATGGGAVVDVVIKDVVRRARPTYGTSYLHFHSYSFPSGHAMAATIGFGMLAYVVHRRVPGRGTAVAAYAMAAMFTLLICATRVYLGVHFPSDVLGGCIAGLAWLIVCITGAGVAGHRAATRATPTV